LIVGGMAIVLVLVIAFVPRPGSSDTSDPDPAATTTTTAELVGPVVPEPLATPVETAVALAEILPAVDRLLAEEALVIEGRSDLAGQVQTFDIDFDALAPAYRTLETVGTETEVQATVERVTTADTIYLRVVDEDPEIEPRWSVIPVTVEEQLDLEQIFTLFGRISPDLANLAVMWTELPVQADRLTAGDDTGYRLTLRADEVTSYLRDNELSPMGPSDEIGATTFEVWLDGPDLRRLVAGGVQFFTGEPFQDASIDITYRPGPVVVVRPDVVEE
jgi:hypothetical protein